MSEYVGTHRGTGHDDLFAGIAFEAFGLCETQRNGVDAARQQTIDATEHSVLLVYRSGGSQTRSG